MTLHLHLTVTDKSAARLVMDLLQKLSESASPQTIPEGSLQKGAAAPPNPSWGVESDFASHANVC